MDSVESVKYPSKIQLKPLQHGRLFYSQSTSALCVRQFFFCALLFLVITAISGECTLFVVSPTPWLIWRKESAEVGKVIAEVIMGSSSPTMCQ